MSPIAVTMAGYRSSSAYAGARDPWYESGSDPWSRYSPSRSDQAAGRPARRWNSAESVAWSPSYYDAVPEAQKPDEYVLLQDKHAVYYAVVVKRRIRRNGPQPSQLEVHWPGQPDKSWLVPVSEATLYRDDLVGECAWDEDLAEVHSVSSEYSSSHLESGSESHYSEAYFKNIFLHLLTQYGC